MYYTILLLSAIDVSGVRLINGDWGKNNEKKNSAEVPQSTIVYYNVLLCTTFYQSVLQNINLYYKVLVCTTKYYSVLRNTTLY